MEMPELNEDMMEAGEVSGEIQSDPVAEEGEEGEVSLSQGEEGETSAIEHPDDDNTLDSSDIPKQDEDTQEPLTMEDEEDTSDAKDEPAAKKVKLDFEAEEQAELGEASMEPPMEGEKADEQTGEKSGCEEPQPDTDMLSTLASAALKQDDKEEKPAGEPTPAAAEVTVKEEPGLTASKKRTEQWHNVGVFETNSTVVTDYMAAPASNMTQVLDPATINVGGRRIQLEPGTAYKLRVCAVNACGLGPWSEVAAFKTTLPGFPGAPSAIKISKTADGAHLTWEPPGGNSGEILEYAVYLAVRSASQGSQPVTTNQAQLAFVRVFCGPTNKCVVGPNSLQAAHIDTTTKPAIIFRIAARNEKGYGPATQVRWLQESATSPPGNSGSAGKRAAGVRA